jgi:hypothetical protein
MDHSDLKTIKLQVLKRNETLTAFSGVFYAFSRLYTDFIAAILVLLILSSLAVRDPKPAMDSKPDGLGSMTVGAAIFYLMFGIFLCFLCSRMHDNIEEFEIKRLNRILGRFEVKRLDQLFEHVNSGEPEVDDSEESDSSILKKVSIWADELDDDGSDKETTE